MHDMPMTNTEDKPVKFKIKEGAYIERRFGETFLCISDTKPYSAVRIDFQHHFRAKPDDFCGDAIQPAPKPKPLWELMPEIVKGRRFRDVDTDGWIAFVNRHECRHEKDDPVRFDCLCFMTPTYILEPIE